jgi:hypothetical protein
VIRFKWQDARSASPAQAASTSPRYPGKFDAMTRRRISWCIAAAVAIWPAAALAADLPAEPKPVPTPAPAPAPASAAILPPPDGACLEWTDGCRICQKPAAGETACSNVSIACVPQPARCLKH